MPSEQQQQQLICGGELEIVKITKDLHDEAWEIFRNYFLVYENVSIALNLNGTPESVNDMELLFRGILQDNISFAARHCESKKLAAICVNKILNPSTNCTCDAICAQFNAPNMSETIEFLERMENTFNIFKEWNIDCVMEIFFLSTRPEFGKRGLATILSQYSIEFARKMLAGNLPEGEELPAHLHNEKPKAVTSLFTSRFTQLLGEKLGFQVLNKVPYTEFTYEGKTFAEKIDAVHEFAVYAALRL